MKEIEEYYVLGCERKNYKGEDVIMYFSHLYLGYDDTDCITDRLSELPDWRKYSTYEDAKKALESYDESMNLLLDKAKLWQMRKLKIRKFFKGYDNACFKYMPFISLWSLDDVPKIAYSFNIFKVKSEIESTLTVERVSCEQ